MPLSLKDKMRAHQLTTCRRAITLLTQATKGKGQVEEDTFRQAISVALNASGVPNYVITENLEYDFRRVEKWGLGLNLPAARNTVLQRMAAALKLYLNSIERG